MEKDRKTDHLEIIHSGLVEGSGGGFDRIQLDHFPLSELCLGDIRLEKNFLGRKFSLPIFVSSMTGGKSISSKMNHSLAKFCVQENIPMGLGSMREILEDPAGIHDSFLAAREVSEELFLLANIGAQQLVGKSSEQLWNLLESVKANALFVHLNPLQEVLQKEGDRDFSGILGAIKETKDLGVPVVLKETGCGFGRRALRLIQNELPFVHVDLAGFGGAHWGQVEKFRYPRESFFFELAQRFDHWGVSTLESLYLAKKELLSGEIYASGGMRNAQDVVKAMCLGASAAGFASPIIRALEKRELQNWINLLKEEMKRILLLIGCADVEDLDSRYLL